MNDDHFGYITNGPKRISPKVTHQNGDLKSQKNGFVSAMFM
jgi:hypothetical protein